MKYRIYYPGITQDWTRDFHDEAEARAFYQKRMDAELHRHQLVRFEMIDETKLTYSQFVEHLWNWAKEKGLGYSDAQMHAVFNRDRLFALQQKFIAGDLTLADAEQAFADALRRYFNARRPIAEDANRPRPGMFQVPDSPINHRR